MPKRSFRRSVAAFAEAAFAETSALPLLRREVQTESRRRARALLSRAVAQQLQFLQLAAPKAPPTSRGEAEAAAAFRPRAAWEQSRLTRLWRERKSLTDSQCSFLTRVKKSLRGRERPKRRAMRGALVKRTTRTPKKGCRPRPRPREFRARCEFHRKAEAAALGRRFPPRTASLLRTQRRRPLARSDSSAALPSRESERPSWGAAPKRPS